jgi:pre-mRNA cleavage complex 2 protein Pcf11
MQVDEDEALDESQLEEYGEMLDDVGTVAEKVKVNTLTMIAEDYADSPKDASKLCRLIHYRLVSTKVRADHKLPLVYVVDSILKNVQGTYVTLMENDIMEWMPIVAAALPEHDERKGRPKLKKVWMLWKDSGIFSLDVWQKLGQCFISSSMNEGDGSAGQINPVLKAAGIDFGVGASYLI